MSRMPVPGILSVTVAVPGDTSEASVQSQQCETLRFGEGCNMEKPTARGPSPSRKAERALGPRRNRKMKAPPDPQILDGGKLLKPVPHPRKEEG
jgi:hypothetical protein